MENVVEVHVGGLNLLHHHQQGYNNKNPRQILSRWSDARYVERFSAEERDVPLIKRVGYCCSHAGFCTIPMKLLRQCSREIGIEKFSVHWILRAQK